MTPDLLYRFNYGPLTKDESNDVARFIRGQLANIKAMQSSRTLASRSAKSWSSMLPLIRPPISIEIDSRREGRPTSLKPENTELLFFGFFDPRLVVELLSQLYPSSSYFITGGQGDN